MCGQKPCRLPPGKGGRSNSPGSLPFRVSKAISHLWPNGESEGTSQACVLFVRWFSGSQVDSIGNYILVLVPKALLYALFSDLIQFEHLDLSNRYEWDGIELFLFCISFVSVFWTVFRSHWISSGCWLLVARHPSPHSQTRCSHSAWGQNTLWISWMSCFLGQRIDGTRSR